MRPLLLALACLVLTLQAQAEVQAQNYPTRPFRLISPFAAGGANDVLARVLGTSSLTVFQVPSWLRTDFIAID